MNLKASFFNKSIFKSDMKRFWWLGLLETFIILLAYLVPLYERCSRAMYYDGHSYGQFSPEWLLGIVILFVFAVGVSVILLSYMHFTASVSSHHSLPIKRQTLLATKLISSATLTIIPIFINAVILIIMATVSTVCKDYISGIDVIKWAFAGVMYTLVFLSLATVVNMMTGNPIGTLIFTLGFMFLPVILEGFLIMFYDEMVYGYTEPSDALVSEYLYLAQDRLCNFPYMFIYIALVAIFTAFAFFLYKKRKLENYGEVIAFSWLKPVFIAIVAMFSSMLSFVYFYGVLGVLDVFAIIPLGIVGTVIAFMVSRKRVSLKGTLKPVLIYTACALVFSLGVMLDLTGYERRVPDIDEIESATCFENSRWRMGVEIDGEYYPFKAQNPASHEFTEKEDLENLINVHEYLIENKDNAVFNHNILPIEYKLKNGRTLKRLYKVDYTADKEHLRPVFESDEYRSYQFGLLDGTDKEFVSITVTDRRIGERTIYPDNPYMQKLVAAMKADLSEIPYEEYVTDGGASINLNFNYIREVEGRPDYQHGSETDSYSVRRSYKNTITVLYEMGYLLDLPKASDIKSAKVVTWQGYEYSAKDMAVKEEGDEVIVTDGAIIEAFYKEYDNMIEYKKYSGNDEFRKNIRISYNLNSGREFEVSCSYDEDTIPDMFKGYFK